VFNASIEVLGASLNNRLTLRSRRQARVRVVAIPVGGLRKGQLYVVHEIQHCPVETESTSEDEAVNLRSIAAGCYIGVSGGRISPAE
jgi:hypothetical protein